MPSSLVIVYPPEFTRILQSFKILSFDFVKFTPVECVQRIDFIDSMMVTTLVPIFGFAVLVLAFMIHLGVLHCKYYGTVCFPSSPSSPSPSAAGDNQLIGDKNRSINGYAMAASTDDIELVNMGERGAERGQVIGDGTTNGATAGEVKPFKTVRDNLFKNYLSFVLYISSLILPGTKVTHSAFCSS